jgi:chromatin segregation and condensation protein Rec8/ScpA/Scc1 (kleisin family)
MDQYDIQMLAEQPWEETLEALTADMPAEEVDITVLTDRYKEYIDQLQQYDLQVPARAIRVCAALLKMKATAVYFEDEQQEEEMVEDPMAFEDGEMIEEEDKGRNPELEMGPELDIPVKAKPRRRVQLDELKDSLRSALEIKEKREQRQARRAEMDEVFEMDEEDLTSKIDSLFNTIKGMISEETKEEVEFEKIVESNNTEEKIEKFKHILHLENDRKVDVIQEEFFDDLKVRPESENSKGEDENCVTN